MKTTAFIFIQCTDKATGKTGSFLGNDDGIAISPVFSDLAALFPWAKKNGWRDVPDDFTLMEK